MPRHGGFLERFKLAAAAGFHGVELEAVADRDEAERARAAADAAGIHIHAVKTIAHWLHPLSSEEPRERELGIRATLGALENARLWGADTLLLIPGVVTSHVSYAQAWQRSHDVIRSEILPAAREMGVVLTVENVWNGFLLSPDDYVRYIDAFESPWLKANLDLGNMVFGYPEHWVRATGHRIVKLHVKDFGLDMDRGRFRWSKVGEGAIRWSSVKEALAEVQFAGWVTNTESLRGLISRAANFGTSHLGALARLPGVNAALWNLQRPAALRVLRHAAVRVKRFLG